METRIKLITSILFISLLSACSTVTPPSAPPAAPTLSKKEREESLNKIQNWQINGKIAARTQADAGSATINWVQQHHQYNIDVLGPFGAQGLKLFGNANEVIMVTANGQRFSAKSPEQLMKAKWGFNVPISYLHYWIRGLAVPNVSHQEQLDTYGRLSTLRQQNWLIQFLSYENVGSISLPNKISIYSPAISVKIVIYKWQI